MQVHEHVLEDTTGFLTNNQWATLSAELLTKDKKAATVGGLWASFSLSGLFNMHPSKCNNFIIIVALWFCYLLWKCNHGNVRIILKKTPQSVRGDGGSGWVLCWGNIFGNPTHMTSPALLRPCWLVCRVYPQVRGRLRKARGASVPERPSSSSTWTIITRCPQH